MTTQHHGYTMMEMVAVLAVISILALMAVPSYLDRIIRQQIEAALPLAEIAKKPVADAWAVSQTFPANNEAAGLPAADKIVNNYISALTVENGAIRITFGNQSNKSLQGKTLSLRPAVVADAPVVPVTWVCGQADVPDKRTVNGSNQTTVPDTFLPLSCRSIKQK
jgi:type IV pilus assembly protein PilA